MPGPEKGHCRFDTAMPFFFAGVRQDNRWRCPARGQAQPAQEKPPEPLQELPADPADNDDPLLVMMVAESNFWTS